jgi:hypothetical protein
VQEKCVELCEKELSANGARRNYALKIWSGIRESNPRLDLGKVAYYHYTNPAA